MADKKKRAPFVWILFSVITLLVAIALVFGLTNLLVFLGGNNIENDFEGKKYDCILVLGAGLYPDGTPSDMLADRLTVAIDLYKKGVSDTVVLSGDRSDSENYDEVSAMEKYCIERGIPAEAIVKDEVGYSTYESMLNLSRMGKYKSVVVVTQRYHLYRALYIAERMELSAVGADATLSDYSGQGSRSFREFGARTKDFFKVLFKT